jgi:hypothetical protein
VADVLSAAPIGLSEAGAGSPLSTRRELELLRDLQRLANERAGEEERIRTALVEGLRGAELARDKAAAETARQFAQKREAASQEHEQASADARRSYEQQRVAAQEQYEGLRQQVKAEQQKTENLALAEQEEADWHNLVFADVIEQNPRQRLMEIEQGLRRLAQQADELEGSAVALMKLRRQWSAGHAVTADVPPDEVPPWSDGARSAVADNSAPTYKAVLSQLEAVEDSMRALRASADMLKRQRTSRLFQGWRPWALVIVLSAIVSLAIGLSSGFGWVAVASGGVSLAVMVVVVIGWLLPLSRRRSAAYFASVQSSAAKVRQAISAALNSAREWNQDAIRRFNAERQFEQDRRERKLRSAFGEMERRKEAILGPATMTLPKRLAELREEMDQSLGAAKRSYCESLALVTEERDRREAESRAEFDRRSRELRARHDRDWQALFERWHGGLAKIQSAWLEMNAACDRLFPEWTADFQTWQRPPASPHAIQFGRVTLDLAKVRNGIPEDERLRPAETVMEFPALMSLNEHPVLVLTAEDEGRREAIAVLQVVMLRMLTAMPPGKVRFTILDPVGLGENFASFMHLADSDEQLISGRIWTDSKQIEEQLTRLTNHTETVLQKYLRNEFPTIHEYNAQAGEVAEPFQVLVVANFPANFAENATRKLVSLAASGPRCGVYTLVSVDRKQRLPESFKLTDLTASAVHLDWVTREGRFRWRYPALEHMPLALDGPPSAERFNEVVRAAGRAAKDSMRVEVPFEQVAPRESEYWSGDSGKELVVPIGRAGARRLQDVRLGKGTSQHVLVCGKTGSGKSTFLHALITNTALRYSPDEVEFYLIDFKKGVEFKTYATHRLPHARVIAIESEREFGLSVLERLDAELRRRGDLLRAAGVQDLPDFRQARPNERMPRILLVIDEFQELFIEDDKLAQDAALLLDRLVRQGRAFGIHVLLGSQTLGGAYSLARSTMGQMAVRVALQCSEADANLILSDEHNMAARFLSRPGEAIYNDQNGLLAGNHPFQVVWLPESKRVEYLRQVEARSRERGAGSKETIVFEGDQPADPAVNLQLREVLERGPTGAVSAPQKAWLGAAVAIKEPTAATFARHAGSNLLVVGAWEESALGVLTNAVIALTAQNPTGSTEYGVQREASSETPRSPLPAGYPLGGFYVLDGTRPESPEAGTWQRVADALPHKIEVADPRDTPRVIGEVAAELARREAAGDEEAPPMYLVIFNGGRFRDLRRGEDDFSFSADRDKPPSPDKQWAEILRNGPAWGIHTLLWCDSYNNVSRLLDRMALREFEMRVAFQMSAADSSSLLDNPAAAKLRQHRGLFASEDLGTLEKFRPYGVPSASWLDEVKQSLSTRHDNTG